MDSKIKELARMIEKAANIVALTGAGCSTSSGIPDFRGSAPKVGSYGTISTEIGV